MSQPVSFPIEKMLNPTAFPHSVDGIELLQTHISWVTLTGQFAYKIKKPVDFGFLDFSTIQRRKHFCEEELRLNGRLAPDLYLDVVPITANGDQLVIGGDTCPIEFAVKMRQFQQSDLLSEVVKRHELVPSHIDRLAGQIARFHQSINVAGPESDFGTDAAVWQPVAENFDRLLSGPHDEWTPRIQQLRDWSQSEHVCLATVFADRKQRGFIRECHGDMHLGNMILDGDDITVFDGIEFNDRLRWIDVISEVAFVVMDLKDLSESALGHRFLNAYLERTGDYAGLKVMRFYEAYRAMVRAKVDHIRSEQSDLTPSDKEEILEDCHHYITLAERITRTTKPRLYITHGVSGSGKTTGTQQLIEDVGAIRVRSDVERKRLLGLSANENTSTAQDAYTAGHSRRTYDRLAALSRSVLKAGYSVVVDATFLRKADRAHFRHLADELTVPFHIVPFTAEPNELRRRIDSRAKFQSDASEATVNVLEQQMKSLEPLSAEERGFMLRVE